MRHYTSGFVSSSQRIFGGREATEPGAGTIRARQCVDRGTASETFPETCSRTPSADWPLFFAIISRPPPNHDFHFVAISSLCAGKMNTVLKSGRLAKPACSRPSVLKFHCSKVRWLFRTRSVLRGWNDNRSLKVPGRASRRKTFPFAIAPWLNQPWPAFFQRWP